MSRGHCYHSRRDSRNHGELGIFGLTTFNDCFFLGAGFFLASRISNRLYLVIYISGWENLFYLLHRLVWATRLSLFHGKELLRYLCTMTKNWFWENHTGQKKELHLQSEQNRVLGKDSQFGHGGREKLPMSYCFYRVSIIRQKGFKALGARLFNILYPLREFHYSGELQISLSLWDYKNIRVRWVDRIKRTGVYVEDEAGRCN